MLLAAFFLLLRGSATELRGGHTLGDTAGDDDGENAEVTEELALWSPSMYVSQRRNAGSLAPRAYLKQCKTY